MNAFNATTIFAYWNLKFEDPKTQAVSRYSIPITHASNTPTVKAKVIEVTAGGDWRLEHETLESGKKLTEVEIAPLVAGFTAADASVEVGPAIPTGPSYKYSTAYGIPGPTGSDYETSGGISGDPGWKLTVKVRRRLSS